MSVRIPVINFSSKSKQSGAEIESMIEHLEKRGHFVASFLVNRSFGEECGAASDFGVRMQVQ